MTGSIIGLSGYARTGKDSLAHTLIEFFGYERVSFADLLRECVYRMNPIVEIPGRVKSSHTRIGELIKTVGWERAKDISPDVRVYLQRLGTDVGRNLFGPDFWVDHTFARMSPDKNYVITDCRFPNEAAAVCARGGIMVRIGRPDHGPANDHPSEVALDDWPFDVHVHNDTTLSDLAIEAGHVYQVAAGMRAA